jgi:hypothetical protein
LGLENDGDFTADTSQKEKAEEWQEGDVLRIISRWGELAVQVGAGVKPM